MITSVLNGFHQEVTPSGITKTNPLCNYLLACSNPLLVMFCLPIKISKMKRTSYSGSKFTRKRRRKSKILKKS